jgi:hypothetical protein
LGTVLERSSTASSLLPVLGVSGVRLRVQLFSAGAADVAGFNSLLSPEVLEAETSTDGSASGAPSAAGDLSGADVGGAAQGGVMSWAAVAGVVAGVCGVVALGLAVRAQRRRRAARMVPTDLARAEAERAGVYRMATDVDVDDSAANGPFASLGPMLEGSLRTDSPVAEGGTSTDASGSDSGHDEGAGSAQVLLALSDAAAVAAQPGVVQARWASPRGGGGASQREVGAEGGALTSAHSPAGSAEGAAPASGSAPRASAALGGQPMPLLPGQAEE